MIWVGGEVVPDDALKVSVLDRTFEHGLGLFETLRTWNGRAVLLGRHLDRLRGSARAFGLPLEEPALPDHAAVAALDAAKGFEGDAAYRITMSGGLPGGGGATVWMTARPLPEPWPLSGIELVDWGTPNDPRDPQCAHKTLNYWNRRISARRASAFSPDGQMEGTPDDAPGPRETLLRDHDGRVWEGSRTNVFAVRHGTLLTPGSVGPLRPGPFVPGIMRGLVLERAATVGLPDREENLSIDSLRTASEVFVTNAVRGLVPVRHVGGRDFEAPGPWTLRLRNDLWGWLNRGGLDP